MKTIVIVVDKDGCTLFTASGLSLTLLLRAGRKTAGWRFFNQGLFEVPVGEA